MKKKLYVIAFGGNALLEDKQPRTFENQLKNSYDTFSKLKFLFKKDNEIVFTHGNGPQVGDLLIKHDLAKDTLPPFPLDSCVAESQGDIGYMLQQSLQNTLKKEGINKHAVCILTQVEVKTDDPAFENPTKPVGPFYHDKDIVEKLKNEKGWNIVEDSGRGYRRVVPSPMPYNVIEEKEIKNLIDNDFFVITVGGGGIPVARKENDTLYGVEAVIDKDLASSVLASSLKADLLVILTAVPNVFINFGKSNQEALTEISMEKAKKYLEDGHFGKGSMEPKIKACIKFLENGGKEVLITSIDKIESALSNKDSKDGTRIVKTN